MLAVPSEMARDDFGALRDGPRWFRGPPRWPEWLSLVLFGRGREGQERPHHRMHPARRTHLWAKCLIALWTKSFDSTSSSSRCWLVLSLLNACFSSRSFAMSFSSSSSMSSHGSILPMFVSFQSVCNCLSLSPPRISRLLFPSPWMEIAPIRYFQQQLWAPITRCGLKGKNACGKHKHASWR